MSKRFMILSAVIVTALGYLGYGIMLLPSILVVNPEDILSEYFDARQAGFDKIEESVQAVSFKKDCTINCLITEGEAKDPIDFTDPDQVPKITFYYHLNGGSLQVINSLSVNRPLAEMITFGNVVPQEVSVMSPGEMIQSFISSPPATDPMNPTTSLPVEFEVLDDDDLQAKFRNVNREIRTSIHSPGMLDFSSESKIAFNRYELESLMSHAVVSVAVAALLLSGSPDGLLVDAIEGYFIEVSSNWIHAYGHIYIDNNFYHIVLQNLVLRWYLLACVIVVILCCIQLWRRNIAEIAYEVLTKRGLWSWRRFLHLAMSNPHRIIFPANYRRMSDLVDKYCISIEKEQRKERVVLQENELSHALENAWQRVSDHEKTNPRFLSLYEMAKQSNRSMVTRHRYFVSLEKAIIVHERREQRIREEKIRKMDTPLPVIIPKIPGLSEREVILKELKDLGLSDQEIERIYQLSITRLSNLVLVTKIVISHFGLAGLEALLNLPLDRELENDSELVVMARESDNSALEDYLGLNEAKEASGVPKSDSNQWRQFVDGKRVVVVSREDATEFLCRLKDALVGLGASEVVVVDPQKKKRVFEAISHNSVFVLVKLGLGHDISDTLSARGVTYRVIKIGSVARQLS